MHSPRAPAGLVVSSLVTIGRFPIGRPSQPAMNRLESADAWVNREGQSAAPSGVDTGGLHPQPVDRATGGEVRGTVVWVPQGQVAGISGNRIIPTGEPSVSKTQTHPAPVQYTRPRMKTTGINLHPIGDAALSSGPPSAISRWSGTTSRL